MTTYRILAQSFTDSRRIQKEIVSNSEEHALRVATSELGDWGYVVDIRPIHDNWWTTH